MRSRLVALVVLAVLAVAFSPGLASGSLSTGDGTWYWQNPLPQGNDLFGVSFPDPVNGWAVGSAGTVLRTRTSGASWEVQSVGTTAALRGVASLDASRAWAVGDAGVVRRTTDGGSAWTTPTSGVMKDLKAVRFADATNGWAVGAGGTILRTSDGGATWGPQAGGTGNDLYGVTFLDASTGVAVGATGTIVRTTDGGGTWTLVSTSARKHLRAVTFVDASTGWIVGDAGTVLRTSDGGASWAVRSPSGWSWLDLKAVAFTDSGHGYLSGGSGKILRTKDAGASWQGEHWGSGRDMNGLAFTGSSDGIVVGSSGIVMRTADAGAAWRNVSFGIVDWQGERLMAVDVVGAKDGWAVSKDGVVFSTGNGGASWSKQSTLKDRYLYDVDFADAGTGWVVGSPLAGSATLMRTTDGGATWAAQSSGVNVWLKAVTSVDTARAWAVGEGGKIVGTTNGGATWNAQTSGATATLKDVSFVDTNNGWVVGDSGTILRTSNGGASWTAQSPNVSISSVSASGLGAKTSSGAGGDLEAVDFVDANNGWAVGYRWDFGAVILDTANGGMTWTMRSAGTGARLNDVAFADAAHGRVAGDGGLLLVTSDGGTTWTRQSSGTDKDLGGLASADATRAWAVGSGGTVLATFPSAIPVLELKCAPRDSAIGVSWTSSPDAAQAATRLLRSSTGFATEPTAATGQIQVFEGTATSFDDTGLANGTTYYYTAFARTVTGDWSTAIVASAWPGIPTTLSAWSERGLVAYGASTIVWGTLVRAAGATSATAASVRARNESGSSDVPVAGRTDITVWRSYDHGQTWSPDGVAIWDAAKQRYKAVRTMTKNSKFQFRFAGDRAAPNFLLPSESGWAWVECLAPVSTPAVKSVVRRNAMFTVSGLVKIRRAGPVKVVLTRRVGSKWVKFKTFDAKRRYYSTYTKYSLRTRLRLRGRWYAKAYYTDSLHAATWTARRYFMVR